jgi:hypothetical protein
MNNRPRTDLMTFGFPDMNRMFENVVSTLPLDIIQWSGYNIPVAHLAFCPLLLVRGCFESKI